MASTYALFASAAFHDRVVEESFVRSGQPLQIGNSPALAVPVPEGVPWLARVEWVSAASARVIDGRGREYLLEPDHDVRIELGPVGLRLSLAPQYPLKRVQLPSWKGSIAWLAIVLMTTVLVQQGGLLWQKRCEWFGICPPAELADGGGSVMITAEYLARLLREDYAGDQTGVIEREIDRPDASRKSERENQFYLPAGSKGPITKMGGAEETAPEPIRTPPEPEELPVPSKKKVEEQLAVEDVGTPIEQPEPAEPTDGVADEDVADNGDDEAVPEPPAEEEEGWGIPDWYDERDALMERLEIEMVLREAKRRVAIDPNDQFALSTLSYYQYLGQDYDGAKRTYEKYISLWPDEPAGYNNLALIYKRQGDYEKEERLYRVALSLEPNDTTAMNNLGVNLAHQGRYDEALAVMERIEALDPGDPYADLHRSKIYAEMGEDDLALEYLEKALKGMRALDTLHHIEFRQDIRIDPSFEKLRRTYAFRAILHKYYGKDSPLQE